MTTLDESSRLSGTRISILKKKKKKRAPFVQPSKSQKFLIAFLYVSTREEQCLSLMYSMYANASNNYPSYTHVSSYML